MVQFVAYIVDMAATIGALPDNYHVHTFGQDTHQQVYCVFHIVSASDAIVV